MTAFSECTPQELLGPLNEVEQKNAPAKLYLAGDRSLLEHGRRVSVVGTRKPTFEGLKRTRAIVKELVDGRITVVSGLAEGIDTEAHETAIACKGKTVAVLGTPLERVFPAKNAKLQQLIMREHLAISQFPSGSKTTAFSFPLRNRTMALLSDSTIIVEGEAHSGTEHQGWEALRLGRLLFFLESLAERKDIPWVQQMLHYGAQILSRSELEAFLENLPQRDRGAEIAF